MLVGCTIDPISVRMLWSYIHTYMHYTILGCILVTVNFEKDLLSCASDFVTAVYPTFLTRTPSILGYISVDYTSDLEYFFFESTGVAVEA